MYIDQFHFFLYSLLNEKKIKHIVKDNTSLSSYVCHRSISFSRYNTQSTLIISAYARYAIIEKSISFKKMEMKSSEVGKGYTFILIHRKMKCLLTII